MNVFAFLCTYIEYKAVDKLHRQLFDPHRNKLQQDVNSHLNIIP